MPLPSSISLPRLGHNPPPPGEDPGLGGLWQGRGAQRRWPWGGGTTGGHSGAGGAVGAMGLDDVSDASAVGAGGAMGCCGAGLPVGHTRPTAPPGTWGCRDGGLVGAVGLGTPWGWEGTLWGWADSLWGVQAHCTSRYLGVPGLGRCGVGTLWGGAGGRRGAGLTVGHAVVLHLQVLVRPRAGVGEGVGAGHHHALRPVVAPVRGQEMCDTALGTRGTRHSTEVGTWAQRTSHVARGCGDMADVPGGDQPVPWGHDVPSPSPLRPRVPTPARVIVSSSRCPHVPVPPCISLCPCRCTVLCPCATPKSP